MKPRTVELKDVRPPACPRCGEECAANDSNAAGVFFACTSERHQLSPYGTFVLWDALEPRPSILAATVPQNMT